MNIRFETTGCRLNQIESESAARAFVEKEFEVIIKPLTAKNEKDLETVLCVINTCAVTQKAEQKDRRMIRLVLEKCPSACVIVTGCYAQLSSKDILSMDERIACLPGQKKSRLSEVPELLKKQISQGFDPVLFAKKLNEGLFAPETEKKGTSENAFKLSTDSLIAHSRSSIKIQDGCNNLCTYCTINIARGHSVSLDAEEVIRRVKKLEEKGQSEVVFPTVNIGQYKGKYKDGYVNFSKLLEMCLNETSKITMRISSLYPEIVDEEFCRVISNKRVRPHFHISVQSGSDNILKSMARSYRARDVLEACNKIKAVKENPFLACDIITGFPGETDEDFEKTMELCKACDFAWVHVFPFSARPGTKAYDMKPKIPQSVSGERASRLSEWAKENKKKYIESFRGKIVEAVLETKKTSPVFTKEQGSSVYHAVTENFLHCELTVNQEPGAPKTGDLIKVRITGPVPSGTKKGGETDTICELVK